MRTHTKYEVINLTDSEVSNMQWPDKFQYKGGDVQLPTHLFTWITPEWVEYLPGDIDGMKIFKIKSLPNDRVERTHDLRHFKMHSSRRKGLLGMRMVGRCIGNLYSSFIECPFIVLAGAKSNNLHFQNVEGHKICVAVNILLLDNGVGHGK